MPLYKEIIEENYQVYFWKITENEAELLSLALLTDEENTCLQDKKHTSKRLEWLASRALINDVFEEKILVCNDEFGKPFIDVEDLNISFSHSGKFVMLGISEFEIGVDVEFIKDKVLQLIHKFLSEKEQADLAKSKTSENALVYWAAKESLIKIYGKKDLALKSEISISDLNWSVRETLGTFKNQISKNPYKIVFQKLDDYIFVVATEQL